MIATTIGARTWPRAVLVLAMCLLLAACGRVTLFSNLDERQANEVLGVLLAQGISADKRSSIAGDAGYQIRVGQGDFPQAMQVLQARGLPGRKYLSVCDVFQRQGFVSSATEEHARLQCSKQQELEETLSAWVGVADARVHIAMPERDPISGLGGQASAAVVIFEQAGANVRSEEHHFKVLVKDSVPGLDNINQVSVKFNTLPVPSEIAAGQRGVPPVVSAMSPVTLAIVVAAIALLALLVTFGNRVRVRLQGRSKVEERVWKG